MKIGIIGSGQVGRTLAKAFKSEGYDVMLGTRNTSNEHVVQFNDEAKIDVGTFDETAKFGDIIVLATKGTAAEEALHLAGKENLDGKIIIDTTNPIADSPPVNGVLHYTTSLENSMMERLQQVAAVRSAAATVLLPASEFGRASMDELHQQTVSLLSFQTIPRAVYDAQAAYNLLAGLGENATISLSGIEARIRRQYAALAGRRLPMLALQVIAAPVFHGHSVSIAVELDRPVDISKLEDALSGEHVDLVLEDTDSPSNLAATGQNDVLVRLRLEPGSRNPNESARLWLWAASDNLRLYAQNAVECALDLRRLRPQGTVQ